jgi:hypothetical protein
MARQVVIEIGRRLLAAKNAKAAKKDGICKGV